MLCGGRLGGYQAGLRGRGQGSEPRGRVRLVAVRVRLALASEVGVERGEAGATGHKSQPGCSSRQGDWWASPTKRFVVDAEVLEKLAHVGYAGPFGHGVDCCVLLCRQYGVAMNAWSVDHGNM